jgi:hypothetical protein
MRHLLLALLIALLPLRGWMGDAMALASAAHDTTAHPVTTHAMAHSPTAGDTLECLLHGGDAHATGHDAHHPPATEGGTHAHDSCDVCNGPAMALDWPGSFSTPPPHGLTVASAVPFASTVPAQGIKPPIS